MYTVNTDNAVLDRLLSEKNEYCMNNGITLACIADGHSLDFMTETDLRTLFGGAIDNAVDEIARLSENDRSITAIVHKVGELVSANIYNPYAGDIELDKDKLPIADRYKRVRDLNKIAQKYGGICSVALNRNVFILNILLSCK